MSFEGIRRMGRLCVITAGATLAILPSSTLAQTVTDPGIHSLTLALADGTSVDYALVIPENYSAATPVPLVLALHYGGAPHGAGRGVVESVIAPGLEELGAIIIGPDSVEGNWSTLANEQSVTQLLDMIMANYAIDETKTLVTGFSMGGTGSWHFAQEFPERFRAAIPIASRPPALAGWTLPVLAIHSRDDQVAPFTPAEAAIVELSARGVNAQLIAIDGITHYETYRFAEPLQQAVPWLLEVWETAH